MVDSMKPECSFTSWYPLFKKDSLTATIIDIPEDVLKYLQLDPFLLPIEATSQVANDSKWNDGTPVTEDEDSKLIQPTFTEFSQRIKDVIAEYGAVFIKSNWSSPSDATWIAPTKTLKCKTLEEVYLLLKSSDRIEKDFCTIKNWKDNTTAIKSCLILKQWTDINPCTEFRCFVVENELIAISQRDISQYHSYNESEKYNIQTDIKSFFTERIKNRFQLSNYSFDVVRYKKDKVKIVDFGPLNESTTKGTLFTYEELQNQIHDAPEFRYIGEEIGIQPKAPVQFCIPQELSSFFQSRDTSEILNVIREEIENQRLYYEKENVDTSKNT